MTVKYVNVWDVFPQKEENALVYPHENIKNRRERDGVTTSQTNCMCKRVRVKNVFFLCFLKTVKDSFKTFQNKKQKNVVEYTCMTNVHVPAWTTAKGNVVMFLPYIICSHFAIRNQRTDTQWENNTTGQAHMQD
jgi:hypothetical protein